MKTPFARLFASCFLLAAMAPAALASKAMDEKMKEQQTEYKTSIDAIKSACGCAPSVKTGKFGTPDDAGRISSAVSAIADAAKTYCSEAKYKKAFCSKVKTIQVNYAKDVGDPSLKGGTLTTKSNDSGFNSDAQFTPIFDTLSP